MSIFGGAGLLANRRTISGAVAATLLSTAVVVAAVQADGSIATNVRLDDGAVWVTNQQEGLVGRLNVRIEELDFAVASSRAADVLQETRPTGEAQPERTVLFSGKDGGVRRVDVVTAQQTGENEIPIVDYRIGGGVGALLDLETGGLWIGSAQQVVAPDYPEEPDALVDSGSWLVVTSGRTPDDSGGRPDPGRVLIVDASGWYEVELGPDLEPLREEPEEADPDSSTPTVPDTVPEPTGDSVEEPEPEPLKATEVNPLGVNPADIVEVSAVGQEPVVLLTDGTVVLSDGSQVAIPGEGQRLQQVGSSWSSVLVASDAGLFEVALSSGDISKLTDATGSASAPVRIASCVWGAWTGDIPTYYRSCNGAATDLIEVAGAEPDSELVWRVNQFNIALNSVGNGDVWADKDGTLAYVGNWSDVEPNADDSEDVRETTGESQIVVEKTCIEGGAEAPTAGDDQVGVRPRQTIIDLLNNDDDVNCEPIAITSVEPSQGDWGQLTIINNGQHVLYSPSDAVLGLAKESIQTFQFTYVVSDIGGNTSAPATATVNVKDYALGNSPPELRPKTGEGTREMRAVVEEGRAISYNVMADWWDPDGDDLRLASAVPVEAGQVASTPDGLVRFEANGVPAGVESVDISMSDGIDTATETLEVTVKPVGSAIPPVTSPDFVTLVVGGTTVISPLENDSDPNENTLSLRPLWTQGEVTGYQAIPQGDSVEITAIEPGVYALDYEATDGVDAAKGTVRLEIVAPGEVNSAPIAVPDQAKLRPDRVVNVDVLANDVDADGDLLALTDVQVSAGDPALGIVRATLVDRRMVQVQVVPGPNGEDPVGPFVVTYVVSDGQEQTRANAGQSTEQSIADSLRSQGAVTVLVQPPTDDQPPVLVNDTATVRSGDIVGVPVLRNDTDPDSDPIELISVDEVRAAELEAAGEGVAWVEGRDVFFQGGTPGRYSILYTVEAAGKRASGELSVVVKDLPNPDTNPNQPPSPPDLELRAIRNATVRVPIPSYGIDPDGDAVVLLADLGLPAVAGNTVALDEENPEVVLYSAGLNSGPRDSFTYTVRDRYGARATGTVEVVVLDDGGWAPQANDDVFRGKPGRTMSIPVVANDTSPQDRRLEIAEDPFFDADGQPSTSPQNPDGVRLLDQENPDTRGRIEVDVPTDGVVLVEHYRISDGLNPASAFLRVTPDREAPNLPPVAQTDEVTVQELQGATEATLDVLANDFDPDDAVAALELSLPANQNGTIVGGQLVVPRTEFAQRVLYRITDAEGATAIGVARVPGLENQAPTLSDVGRVATNRVIEAAAPAPLTILLSDIVEDPDGDPDIKLTDTELSSPEIGEITRLEDGSGFVYTPPTELSTSATVSIGFEVTDRPERTLEERQLPTCNCLSALTVDVVIEAASPPIVVGQGAVQVPQLDETVTYDLAPLTRDEQGDALTYTLDSSTFGGLEVQSNGSQVTLVSRLEGDGRIPVGSSIRINYTVADDTFDPVDNYFVVTMVATNKGQPAPASFSPIEAERSVSIDTPNFVNAAFNPFAGDGRVLTLINPTASGGATITCSETGDCSFVSERVGTFTITYTLQDAVEQTATGTFEILVKGKPFAPGVPSIESVGDRVVNLTWTAADMQGGEFVTYQVTAVEAGITQNFTSTGGQFTGLRNAQTYTFTVLAENELGLGERSAPSTGATPDRVPDPPVALAFTNYADRQLSVSWQRPPTAGDFSAIIGYQVRIGGQVLDVAGGSTALTIGLSGEGDPLSNGTDYSFEMRARNSAVTDNGWGAWSGRSGVTERPSRFPDPPRNVLAANAGDGGTPRISVRWTAPANDGGRALNQYQVCRVQDNNCQTVGASSTQATFNQARAQAASFTVVALNTDKNRNFSDPSAPSPTVIAVGNPDAPVISSVASQDKQLVAAASTTNNSGCGSVTLEYSRNGGTSWQASSTFAGLTNGTPYTIIARARLAASCGTPGQTYLSANSAGVPQTPYGPLAAPSISAAASPDGVTWTWGTNRSDDGRPGWSAQLSGDCGSQTLSTGQNASGNVSIAPGRTGSTYSCTIIASANGVASLSASASGQTWGPPSVSIAWDGSAEGEPTLVGGLCSANCRWVRVTVRNFVPGNYNAVCESSEDDYIPFTSSSSNADRTANVGSNGTGTARPCYFGFLNQSIRVVVNGITSNSLAT